MTEKAVWYEAFLPMSAMDFLALGKLAVAAASDEEEVLEVIREIVSDLAGGDFDEVELFGSVHRASNDVPDAWSVPILGLLAVENDLVAFEDLTYGRLHRRIDALFDMFDTNFCAHQIQELFFGFLNYLAETAKDPTAKKFRDVGEIAAACAGGFAGGWFGMPGAGQVMAKGARWLLDADEEISDPLATAAKLLTLFELLPEDEGGFTPEEELLRAFARDQVRVYGAEGASIAASPYRAWVAAFEAMGGHHDESGEVMPDLLGGTYGSAIKRLGVAGIILAGYIDATKMREEGDRFIWQDSNWVVAAQFPESGDPLPDDGLVFVAVKKPGESAKTSTGKRLIAELPDLRKSYVEPDSKQH